MKITYEGAWVQGCCACNLYEATERTKMYAEKGRGTRYALIDTDSGWVGVGHVYRGYEPLCGILRDSSKDLPVKV